MIAHVAEGDAEDIKQDVFAARKAFDDGPWPRMLAYERSRIMLRFADLVEKHNYEIAALETWDNGKPYEQSANIEVPMFARLLDITLEGVLNVVSGFGPTAGAALSSHMEVDKTGKIILRLAAQSNLKTTTLELGGKSPFIVCEDADVDKAVELAHFALFFNQGQCCYAGSRTYVHERVYDKFIAKGKTRAMKRTVDDPFKSTTADVIKGVISLIFDKALLEPLFCPMYAMLCSDLNENLPHFPSEEPGGKDITFKRALLNICLEAFERR